jgi:prepilin-type N-terminal cleavage/methylation domain-containing protein
MKHYRLTPAFTMLELIFVIVILGIVASIGSEMIAKVYESYIVQRAEHRATLKTELAATQIANRLASAIPGTVYRIKNDDTYELIQTSLTDSGDSYKGLQWVGSDTDSFNATATTPGWSGFCDIDDSNKNSIKSQGSNFSFIGTIRANFGYTNAFAIYFPYDNTPYYESSTSGDTITLDNNASHIVEHYKLARTSYALVAEDNGRGGKDLYLYYNFIPTPAIAIPNTASKSLLLANIATFKFKGAGRTIRFKICKQEQISENENENITACKEKAVF